LEQKFLQGMMYKKLFRLLNIFQVSKLNNFHYYNHNHLYSLLPYLLLKNMQLLLLLNNLYMTLNIHWTMYLMDKVDIYKYQLLWSA
jgi:hypothetical protein